jgi:hypothetical protein
MTVVEITDRVKRLSEKTKEGIGRVNTDTRVLLGKQRMEKA